MPQPAALWPSPRNVLWQRLTIFSSECYQILFTLLLLLLQNLWKPSKFKVEKTEPEVPPVVDVDDDLMVNKKSVPNEVCKTQKTVPNNGEILVAENEPVESAAAQSPVGDSRPSGSRRTRMRLRNKDGWMDGNLSPKNFAHYQLEYAHWLHMSGYRATKRRRHIAKRSEVDVARRRSVELARRRRMEAGLPRRRPITSRPTKLLQLDSSDRPAIKSVGPAVSQAPVNLLRFPPNVVDVDTVDAAVSSCDDRGVSDGVRTAIEMHFGAMARIKAGAKCRIMARRWTTDDRLEYLVQWEAGIVT